MQEVSSVFFRLFPPANSRSYRKTTAYINRLFFVILSLVIFIMQSFYLLRLFPYSSQNHNSIFVYPVNLRQYFLLLLEKMSIAFL